KIYFIYFLFIIYLISYFLSTPNVNNQEKILLAFAAAQAMKTFSDTCKNSGIKVSKTKQKK
ncbi:MAG: hypothetical protein ACPHY8_06785, partial [Patescibacteria group bacterium]